MLNLQSDKSPFLTAVRQAQNWKSMNGHVQKMYERGGLLTCRGGKANRLRCTAQWRGPQWRDWSRRGWSMEGGKHVMWLEVKSFITYKQGLWIHFPLRDCVIVYTTHSPARKGWGMVWWRWEPVSRPPRIGREIWETHQKNSKGKWWLNVDLSFSPSNSMFTFNLPPVSMTTRAAAILWFI